MSLKSKIIVASFILFGFAFAIFIVSDEFFPRKSEFDIPTKENAKLISMFDTQLEINIKHYSHYDDVPLPKLKTKVTAKEELAYRKLVDEYSKRGITQCESCLTTAQANVRAYLKTISTIESYARYGVTSTKPRNKIELKITFINGEVADEVYTGVSCSGYLKTVFIMKVFLKEGKTIKALTNGVEKNGSPDWILNDLNTLIEGAISYDIQKNRNAYFLPEKNKNDFNKEWEDKK
jgi:hypothetical protein